MRFDGDRFDSTGRRHRQTYAAFRDALRRPPTAADWARLPDLFALRFVLTPDAAAALHEAAALRHMALGEAIRRATGKANDAQSEAAALAERIHLELVNVVQDQWLSPRGERRVGSAPETTRQLVRHAAKILRAAYGQRAPPKSLPLDVDDALFACLPGGAAARFALRQLALVDALQRDVQRVARALAPEEAENNNAPPLEVAQRRGLGRRARTEARVRAATEQWTVTRRKAVDGICVAWERVAQQHSGGIERLNTDEAVKAALGSFARVDALGRGDGGRLAVAASAAARATHLPRRDDALRTAAVLGAGGSRKIELPATKMPRGKMTERLARRRSPPGVSTRARCVARRWATASTRSKALTQTTLQERQHDRRPLLRRGWRHAASRGVLSALRCGGRARRVAGTRCRRGKRLAATRQTEGVASAATVFAGPTMRGLADTQWCARDAVQNHRRLARARRRARRPGRAIAPPDQNCKDLLGFRARCRKPPQRALARDTARKAACHHADRFAAGLALAADARATQIDLDGAGDGGGRALAPPSPPPRPPSLRTARGRDAQAVNRPDLQRRATPRSRRAASRDAVGGVCGEVVERIKFLRREPSESFQPGEAIPSAARPQSMS